MNKDEVLATLLPCPFCGKGETDVREYRLPPSMSGKSSLISVEINHWCPVMPGGLTRRSVSFAGREATDAIAAWNRRTS